MSAKYPNYIHYCFVKTWRFMLRAVLRCLVSWPVREPRDEGYTLIIGCLETIPELALANLSCLARQDTTHLAEVILVFDGLIPAGFEDHIGRDFPALPFRVLCYSRFQRWMTRIIRWPWVNSWLSWCIGIGACRTRYAVLHDLDAMLIRHDFLKDRFVRIRADQADYLGARYYHGNGVIEEDCLVTTFEMFFDCAMVRRTISPIDVFNHVAMCGGRTADFDTFLYAQTFASRRQALAIAEEHMVHPSQMICQWAYHQVGDRRLRREANNLMVLPYFISLTGNEQMMRGLTAHINEPGWNGQVMLGRRPLDVAGLRPAHVAWICNHIQRLESAVHGSTRDSVREYLETLCRVAGLCPNSEGVNAE